MQVAVQRVRGKRCRNLRSARRVRFARAARCGQRRWLRAKGTQWWTFSVRRRLPRGRYRVYVRAVDAAGKRSKPRRLSVRVR